MYYNHGAQGPVGLVSRRSYLGAVQAVHLNATHAAVQTDGRLLLHTIKPSSQQHRQQHDDLDEVDADICLPKTGAHQQDPIVCAALSQFFIITATAAGSLTYYQMQDGNLGVVNDYRHTGEVCKCIMSKAATYRPCHKSHNQHSVTPAAASCPLGMGQGPSSPASWQLTITKKAARVHAGGTITHLFPQPAGPRLVLADDRMLVALYSPVNDELTALPGFEGSLQQVSGRQLPNTTSSSLYLTLIRPSPCM